MEKETYHENQQNINKRLAKYTLEKRAHPTGHGTYVSYQIFNCIARSRSKSHHHKSHGQVM